MGPWAQFGLGVTLATVGFAWACRRDNPHAHVAAWAFLTSGCVCWAMHAAIGPTYRRILPLNDFALLLLMLYLVIAEVGRLDFYWAARWKSWLTVTLLAQATIHLAYPADAPLAERWPFLFSLSVLNLVQLTTMLTASLRSRFVA